MNPWNHPIPSVHRNFPNLKPLIGFAGLDIAEFPHVQAWLGRVGERPAVQKGSVTPLKVDLDALEKDKEAFGKYLKGNVTWIKQGMEVDHKN